MALSNEDLVSLLAMVANPNNSALMEQLREQMAQVEDAAKKNATLIEQNNALLAKIKDERAANAKLLDDLAAQKVDIETKSANFADMVNTQNANQRTWEDQHQQVSAQQAAKEADLNQRQSILEGKERDYLAKASDLRDQQVAVTALATKHKAAAELAKRFYETVS